MTSKRKRKRKTNDWGLKEGNLTFEFIDIAGHSPNIPYKGAWAALNIYDQVVQDISVHKYVCEKKLDSIWVKT